MRAALPSRDCREGLVNGEANIAMTVPQGFVIMHSLFFSSRGGLGRSLFGFDRPEPQWSYRRFLRHLLSSRFCVVIKTARARTFAFFACGIDGMSPSSVRWSKEGVAEGGPVCAEREQFQYGSQARARA